MRYVVVSVLTHTHTHKHTHTYTHKTTTITLTHAPRVNYVVATHACAPIGDTTNKD